MAYQALFWETFEECKHTYRKNQVLLNRLQKTIDKIIESPLRPPAHWLTKVKHIDLRGKCSIHFADDYCVVYLICDACINNGFRDKGYNKCHFCTGVPEERVIFLAFDHHKTIYSREWGIPEN